MKFFLNRSFKQLSLLVAAIVLGIVLLEIFWLQNHFNKVEGITFQIDFARTLQSNNQQLSLFIEQYEKGTNVRPKILSVIEEQELQLQLLLHGGTLTEKEVELNPLARLPRITFENLMRLWEKQKSTLSTLSEGSLDLAKAQTATVSEWYGRLVDDLYKEAAKARNAFTSIVIGVVMVDIVLFGILMWGFATFILKPLKTIEENTRLHRHTNGFYKNEIKVVADEINAVIEQLRDATDFVKGIGEGKLDMDYKTELDQEYQPGTNKLADELIAMQDKLRTLNREEQQRTWSNEGLAKFVDILRNTSDDLNTLGDKIISNLVQYTRANQGALYILNDDQENQKYLELISMFAFDVKKYEKQRVKLGEGILGQTFLEKETTYLTDIPADYVRITSGLGEASPQSVLMVPLKVDREVYGIVELASFNGFLPHEISFVERLGETIASTLSSVKINQKNRKLLEQFQQQTEQMRSQEEEMRQNMEELTATQEGMHRLVKEAQDREAYLNSLMDASPDAIAAIDREYKVVFRNSAPLFDKFLTQGIRYEKGYYVLGLFKKDEFDYHKGLYDRAFAGETITVTKDYFGRKYSIAYNPIRSINGESIGVSIFAHDVTELEQLKGELAEKEQHYTAKINSMEAERKSASADEHWKIAAEIEKTFRVQLEALSLMKNAGS